MQICLERNILHMYTVGTNTTNQQWRDGKEEGVMLGREMTTVESGCVFWYVLHNEGKKILI